MRAVWLAKAVPRQSPRSSDGPYELVVTEEGKRLLKSAEFNQRPLLVVSIAGAARTGKSTMLNCILKRLGCNIPEDAGFAVGHTVEDTTEGIWLWHAPVVVKDSHHQLVLLDIEGCDSIQKNEDTTNSLYCLGYALSSVMLWNIQGKLNEGFRRDLARLAHAARIIMPAEEAYRSHIGAVLNGTKNFLANKCARSASLQSTTDDTCSQDQEEQTEKDETLKEYAARMAVVGKDGPALCILLRDFALKLGQMTPKEYLMEALEVKAGHNTEQQLGAQAANNLFKTADIIMFPVPPRVPREDFGTLTDAELGPDVVQARETLIHKLTTAQPRDVMKLNSAAPYLTGELLQGFLCELVDQINANGVLELQSLGANAVKGVNNGLVCTIQEEFEEWAANELEQRGLTGGLYLAGGLAAYRQDLKVKLSALLANFKPQGSKIIKEACKRQLELNLQQRVDKWEKMAHNRHETLLATEVRVYTDRVEGEIRQLAREHLPCTSIVRIDEAERIWDKVLMPQLHKQLSNDRLYQVSKGEVQASLTKLRIEILKKQEEANGTLINQARSHACIIKGTDIRHLMVHLDRENYLRGVPAMCDNLPNLHQLFLTSTGGVLGRLPTAGDEVAIYSIADKAVWKAELRNFRYRPRYVLCGLPWQLGDTSLPRESLFTVHAKGNSIMLHGMGRGFVIRLYHAPTGKPTKSDYSLGREDLSSRFVLVDNPMNRGEQAAFEAAVKGAVALALEPGLAGIKMGIGMKH